MERYLEGNLKEISENLKEQYKIEIDKKKIEVKETIKI